MAKQNENNKNIPNIPRPTPEGLGNIKNSGNDVIRKGVVFESKPTPPPIKPKK